MYLISSRNTTTDGKSFSKADAVLAIEPLKRLRSGSADELMESIKGKHILVLVHGFNNSFKDVLTEYLIIQSQYERFFGDAYDHIIGYVWPGGESEMDYFLAKQHAERAGHRFRKWLHQFSQAECTIDIMGHSMAALVGYHALKTETVISIRNIFSFGAAISRERLSEEESLYKLIDKVSSLYIFHTRNDGILKYGFRLIEWRDALGYSGPGDRKQIRQQFAKINVIDCSDVIQDHTGYKKSKEVFQFISEVLEGRTFKQFIRLSPDVNEVYHQILKPVFN